MIISARSLWPCDETYSQVPGIQVWSSAGDHSAPEAVRTAGGHACQNAAKLPPEWVTSRSGAHRERKATAKLQRQEEVGVAPRLCPPGGTRHCLPVPEPSGHGGGRPGGGVRGLCGTRQGVSGNQHTRVLREAQPCALRIQTSLADLEE